MWEDGTREEELAPNWTHDTRAWARILEETHLRQVSQENTPYQPNEIKLNECLPVINNHLRPLSSPFTQAPS